MGRIICACGQRGMNMMGGNLRVQVGISPGRRRAVVTALLLLGAFMRLWQLGQTPGGVHQDEAFSAYEAYCLLENGMDSWGYPYPVYFTAWGSGMNALEIYLMMPFVAAFGLATWAIRLPQAIVACLTLPAFYGVMRRLFGERTGLTALALLAICPWHILLARWGIESNLAPGFLTFGLYFFVRGVERSPFFLLSALFYGLSLYAYATIWLVVPGMLLLMTGYLIWTRRLRVNGWSVGAATILLAMAVPLLLYLLVNRDVIEQIVTPYFSIPRMRVARIDEVSLGHIAENAQVMLRMLALQRDGELYNAPEFYGLYYFLSTPFIALGAVDCTRRAWDSLRTRAFDPAAWPLCLLIPSLIQGCLISGNSVRLNSIHMTMLMLAALGIACTLRLAGRRAHAAGVFLALGYALLFAGFARHYFTDYAGRVSIVFRDGLEEAVDRAKVLAGEEGSIRVLGGIEFSRILFCDATPPDAYRDSVRFAQGDGRYLRAESFTRYRFGGRAQAGEVIVADFEADLSEYGGYMREEYGWVSVLWR